MPCIPEAYTHLHGSRVLAGLPPGVRLRYNQLCGLMAAEQFLAFEEGIICTAMHTMQRHLLGEPAVAAAIGVLIADEQRHAGWFRTLLQTSAPWLYGDREQHFTRLRPAERLVLRLLARQRDGALILLWFIHVIEEHSVALSHAMNHGICPSLGRLDPRFVAVHRAHLGDELAHLEVNSALVTVIWDRLPPWRRRILGKLATVLLRNLARPKRANLRVLQHLLREYPELTSQRAALAHAVLVGFRRDAPASDILAPAHHPRSIHAWQERKEFSQLSNVCLNLSPNLSLDTPANAPRPWHDYPTNRFGVLLALPVLTSLGYSAVSALSSTWHATIPSAYRTVVDEHIPLIPWMIFPYLSLGAFCLLPAWICPSGSFLRLLRAALATTLIAYAIFLLYPLMIERPPPETTSAWAALFIQLHALDAPHNVLPSLHVAYVTLVGCAGGVRSLPVILWGLAIIASTVLIGQHQVLDVASGILLAVVCWWWSGRWSGWRSGWRSGKPPYNVANS